MTGQGRLTPLSVALPGPWWTELTYRTQAPDVMSGVRVRVPVGRGTRVGVVVASGDAVGCSDYSGEIRDIAEVLDRSPLLCDATMRLMRWFCETYLCGMGTAMKALLPGNFLKGDPLDIAPDKREKNDNPQNDEGYVPPKAVAPPQLIYNPVDAERMAQYVELLADGARSLVVFPLYDRAKFFYERLLAAREISDDLKRRVLLFPRSGAKAEWRAWSRLIRQGGDDAIVVGGQSSAMAPLRDLERIVIEDESNNVWRTIRPPIYNVRSLLSMRARVAGASLVMGGRMPSSRAYMHLEDEKDEKDENAKKNKKIFFVDLKLAYSPSVKGVCDTLAVSEPLVRETEAALARGVWAVWILDRKGYAGEIFCEECGASVRCAKCGGTMRWEAAASRTVCIVCGLRAEIPKACPNCKGRLLSAKRPGIEALTRLAKAAINAPVPILSLAGDGEAQEEDEKDKKGEGNKKSKKIAEDIARYASGLLIGTRAAIALFDTLKVGLVGWLDADGEARAQEYDARSRAFGLIWESCWRGLEPEARNVLLQTRRPGRDWQKGLEDPRFGWKIFWRRELAERREFSMPPFMSLVKIEVDRSDLKGLTEGLDEALFEFWSPDGEEPDTSGAPDIREIVKTSRRATVWVRTRKLSALQKILAPLYHIGRARRGFPQTIVWHE